MLTINELIARAAASRGQEVAISVEASHGPPVAEVSWRTLHERCETVAAGYARGGVGPGTIVAVALPTGIEHAIATLAIWRAGGVVLPIDPNWPQSRRCQVESRFSLGLTVDEPTLELRAKHDLRVPTPDLDALVADGLPRSISLSGGTTGESKLVVRNRPWAYPSEGHLSARERRQGMAVGLTQLVGLPMYHAGFGALYHGLALGHRIVIPADRSPLTVASLLERARVEVIRTVPAQMSAVMSTAGFARRDLSALRLLAHTGASCAEAVKREWLSRVDPRVVWEEYGSVERLGVIDIQGDEWLEHPGSIGKPRACDARILLDDGTRAPLGAVGTLYLRSEVSAQPVYIGEGPELVERDGFLTLGDLATEGPGGYLTLAGRADGAINVGGMKVYPRQVERVIEQVPAVRDVMAFGAAHADFGQVVVAQVVIEGSPDGGIAREIRRACRDELPAYMTPTKIDFVSDIGRTESGKVKLRTAQEAGT